MADTEAHCNTLLGASLDPIIKTPDYKVSAVTLEPIQEKMPLYNVFFRQVHPLYLGDTMSTPAYIQSEKNRYKSGNAIGYSHK
jgi:hypothetical protein